MTNPQERIVVERRLRRDRRRGFDRRIGNRRQEILPVRLERRQSLERRGTTRRNLLVRRVGRVSRPAP